MRQPITFAYRNIVFGRDLGDAWALYRVQAQSYDGLSVDEKKELLALIAGFAYGIEADFQLLRVSRAWPLDEYLAQARELVDPDHGDPEHHELFLAEQADELATRELWRPEVYLAVSLDKRDGERLGARGLLADPAGWAADLLARVGLARDARAISAKQMDALAQAQSNTLGRITDFLDAEPATTNDLEWLVRRAFCRGMGEPHCEANFAPQALTFADEDEGWRYVPLEHDVLRLMDAPTTIGANALAVHGERGTSHQALVCLGALPESAPFPGRQAELLYAPLEALDFPVDACLSARFVANDQAVPLVRRRIIDADNAYTEESHGDHGPSAQSAERPRAARELEQYLTGPARPPLLASTISLAVGAPSSDELQRRLERLQREYGPVKLHRPGGDQWPLFVSHLPAQRSRVRGYEDYLTIEQVGAMVPVATHAVGSDRGHYIGHTLSGSRQSVLFDIAEGHRRSIPAAVLLAGTQGAGKTVLMELLQLIGLLCGSRIVDVDPKQERDHRLIELPEHAHKFERIEFSANDDNRGMLDPLRVGHPDLREALAVSFLFELLPRNISPDWQREIVAAVRAESRQAQEQGKPASCGGAISRLLASPRQDAKEAGNTLEVFGDTGFARLGIGDPSTPRPEVGDRQVTTLGIRNLPLPKPSTPKSEYDDEERVGQALVKLLATLAYRLLLNDPSRHALGLFDEAHFLGNDGASRRLLETLMLMGRSLNVTTVLATQILVDLIELSNLIGAFVALGFVNGADTDIELALRLLGRDENDAEHHAALRSFRHGRAVMRDYDNRVAEIQIDPGPRFLARRHSDSPDQTLDALLG